MTSALTRGVHHVGLSVPHLEAAPLFFTDALGWQNVGQDTEYPAAFVSHGAITLTLWRVTDPGKAFAFYRRSNVGLHHLAVAAADDATLMELYGRVREHPGVEIEMEPALMHESVVQRHVFCTMPGRLRIEFATPSTENQDQSPSSFTALEPR